ncbi:MAG: 30S ribosomal protein S17 [Actinobacteria bacterium]|nr:30S ribosomal protein S17 [Actinomycetota bacterium]
MADEDRTTTNQAAEAAETGPATAPAGRAVPPEAVPPEAGTAERGRRKVRTGVVVSDRMRKTVVVRIDSAMRHPLYKKTVRRSTKLKAHDEAGEAHVGDTVRVAETRPLSRTKRWRVVEVVERAR